MTSRDTSLTKQLQSFTLLNLKVCTDTNSRYDSILQKETKKQYYIAHEATQLTKDDNNWTEIINKATVREFGL